MGPMPCTSASLLLPPAARDRILTCTLFRCSLVFMPDLNRCQRPASSEEEDAEMGNPPSGFGERVSPPSLGEGRRSTALASEASGWFSLTV